MDITEPTLLLDKQTCKTNIKQMAQKAKKHEIELRPHMKTHQSAEIGGWFKDVGVKEITVSSVKMAEYFFKHGWDTITIAFPCNTREIDRIKQLAAKAKLTLLVNNKSTLTILNDYLRNDVKVYIELDTGSNRTGLKVNQQDQIKSLIENINHSQYLEWKGFYSHPGHSYNAKSANEIRQVHQSVLSQIQKLRDQLTSVFGTFDVCIGDTPCCSKANNFNGIDAISPGNFVFYDLMQHQIGSGDVSDIAVAMVCPIVDRYPMRNELAIYGGAIHFSKESLQTKDGSHYGKVATRTNTQWEILDSVSCLKSLSQEHGIISCSKDVFDQYQVGDQITILPVHSCLTANLMSNYHSEDGEIINQL